jgi:probable rRNA maturation factor
MIDLDNQTDFQINLQELENIATFITKQDFELILTSDEIIKKINFQYRQIDKATDVLSFPLKMVSENIPIGTVIISIDKAKRGE